MQYFISQYPMRKHLVPAIELVDHTLYQRVYFLGQEFFCIMFIVISFNKKKNGHLFVGYICENLVLCLSIQKKFCKLIQTTLSLQFNNFYFIFQLLYINILSYFSLFFYSFHIQLIYKVYIILFLLIYTIKMNQHALNNAKFLSSPSKTQQIIEYCRQKFINILPNNTTRIGHTSSSLHASKNANTLQSANQITAMHNIIYKKQYVRQLIRQFSVFLQLVIQNCLLSSDPKIKTQSQKILGLFRHYLSEDLNQFQHMIYNTNRNKLPFYQLDCKDYMNKGLQLSIPPQVSLYQDPLMFYIYTKYAQESLFRNYPIQVTRQQRIDILKQHVPFLDPLFIPIVSERLETKAKFSELQDRLLLILVKHKLDISQYRVIYFPNRQQAQIRNRIKNLSGVNSGGGGAGKQNPNLIRDIRLKEYTPLTQQQIQRVVRGFIKWGPRWPVISKYYQCRNSQFLQAQYTLNDKLIKRRQKQKISCPYISLKHLIDTKIQQINKRKQSQMRMMQIQHVPIQIIQLQQRQKHIYQRQHQRQYQFQHSQHYYYQNHNNNHNNNNNNQQQQQQQMEEQTIIEEIQYKVINHLTFQYQEI